MIHDGFLNTYTFKFKNHSFTLKPSPPPKPPATPTPLLLLHKTPFEVAMREEGVFFILTATPSSLLMINKTQPEFQAILTEFSDFFPTDLPPGLPPLGDIQPQIDFVPDASLPNRSHYRMSLTEHEELHKQVE